MSERGGGTLHTHSPTLVLPSSTISAEIFLELRAFCMTLLFLDGPCLSAPFEWGSRSEPGAACLGPHFLVNRRAVSVWRVSPGGR